MNYYIPSYVLSFASLFFVSVFLVLSRKNRNPNMRESTFVARTPLSTVVVLSASVIILSYMSNYVSRSAITREEMEFSPMPFVMLAVSFNCLCLQISCIWQRMVKCENAFCFVGINPRKKCVCRPEEVVLPDENVRGISSIELQGKKYTTTLDIGLLRCVLNGVEYPPAK